MVQHNISLVNFSETWGGGEQWHFITALELLKRGCRTTILAKEGSELHERCNKSDIPCEAFNVSKNSYLIPFGNKRLREYFSENHPDSVVINGSPELKLVANLAKANNARKIIYRRGIPVPIKLSLLNKKLFRHSLTDILSNSLVTQNSIAEIIGYSKLPMHIIPQGIPIDMSMPEKNLSSAPRIGILSRLSKEKGLDLAIEAMQKVIETIPNAKLLIAGKGDFQNILEQQIKETNQEENVELVGFVDDPDTFLKQCDLLLMPSIWEGFGFTLLEGMKHALPCIGFEKTAAEEIIVDGETGFLVPHKDTDALAESIVKALSDEKLQNRLGAAGYTRLKQHYSIERVTNQLLQLIES